METEAMGCCGLTKQMMFEGRGKFNDRERTLRGFDHLCGEGIHNFATAISNGEEWVYKDPLVVGVLRNYDDDEFTVCRVALEDSETLAIRSLQCELLKMDSNTKYPRCVHCEIRKRAFLARCNRAATKREQECLPRSTRLSTLNSPTLLKKVIRSLKKAPPKTPHQDYPVESQTLPEERR
jgi:hypothetical protein